MNQASHTDRNSRHEVIREIISESLEALARQSPDRPPTARAISTKSGYSVGSIYKYFGSIGALAAFLFFKKQSMAAARIRSIIDSHDPHDDVATLSQKIVLPIFDVSTQKSLVSHLKWRLSTPKSQLVSTLFLMELRLRWLLRVAEIKPVVSDDLMTRKLGLFCGELRP